MYTCVFHLWKSFDLDSARVRILAHIKLLLEVFARFEMRHTRVLGAEILTNAYLTF